MFVHCMIIKSSTLDSTKACCLMAATIFVCICVLLRFLKKKIVATICARLCAVEILKKNYVTILAIDISKAFRII